MYSTMFGYTVLELNRIELEFEQRIIYFEKTYILSVHKI